MGRRIVNDVGGYGWRVVTRGKLVSCTLFAICKLWLVYTIRGEARRGEGRRMGKIAVCPRREREREGGEGGWVSLGLGRRCHRRHRIDRIRLRGEGRKHEVSFHRIGVHARQDRSGATSTLGSFGLEPRKSDHLRRGQEPENSLRSREPSSPTRETPFSSPFRPNFISNTANLFPRLEQVLDIFV